MARLAWFTPFPPDRSGIAAYSAEILPALARTHEIDVFIDTTARPGATPGTVDRELAQVHQAPAPGTQHQAPSTSSAGIIGRPFRILSAHDFPWRHARDPYDLTVYQLGNSHSHDYMWAYFVRYPGLTVLHDAQVHQVRAEHLFARGRIADYADELCFSHGDVPDGVRDLVVAGLGGRLFYFWPLLGVVLRAAKVVAVHHRWLAAELGGADASLPIEVIRMGVANATGNGARVREAHAIPPGAVVVAAFGHVTPEKRITQALRALADTGAQLPDVHLLLVGERAEYYGVEAEARAAGVAGRVRITGHVPDEALPDYVDAADICLCLRWPTGRETSASWLRCIAAGKPTIVTDLAHMSEVPALDPRSWTRLAAHQAGDDPDGQRPIGVAVDILDEQHSLNLAIRRLATDTALRQELGANARAYWQHSHTLDCMAADYERAIDRAWHAPDPDRSKLPAHLLADGTKVARAILQQMGVEADR